MPTNYLSPFIAPLDPSDQKDLRASETDATIRRLPRFNPLNNSKVYAGTAAWLSSWSRVAAQSDAPTMPSSAAPWSVLDATTWA